MARFELHHGDCLEVLKTMPDNSVDAVVCDPPYGLSFMGRKWDYDVPEVTVWAECLRVLKPGGHLLAFAGTRTQHRMAVRIEDAGFEIRDMIAWVYGSGFPKSQNVALAMDKMAGAVGHLAKSFNMKGGGARASEFEENGRDFSVKHEPITDAARQWQGWGTALKPALEPITVARKPLIGTVAANVLAHGTGALNIDVCRIEFAGDADKAAAKPSGRTTAASGNLAGKAQSGAERADFEAVQGAGRWPANLIHDGSPEVLEQFPASNGAGGSIPQTKVTGYGDGVVGTGRSDYLGGPRTKVDSGSGSAARFFYCAKASKKDRGGENNHPTVKPTDLMAYLCRLVTPPGGVVLDPFMGSGSTGKAAMLEGFHFIGIEREAEYLEIARARISAVAPEVLSADDLI